MEENIVNLFKNSNDYCMIFNHLFENNRDAKYIKQVIEIVINKCLGYVIDYEDMLENLLYEIDDEEFDIYMQKRYLDVLSKLNPAGLVRLKVNNLEEKELINKTLNSNMYDNLMKIVEYYCFKKLNIKASDMDKAYLVYLIMDILKNEQVNLSDIKYNYGTLSNINFIGNKVLKIGRRETFKLKYDKRYLRPVFRYEYIFNGEKVVIELTEKVDTDSVSKKDLDMIIEEFERKGKRWGDPSIDNIGRLNKPNKVYYRHPILADTGYIKTEESSIVLPAGEIVVIDNDVIYDDEKSYVYKK